MIGLSTTYLVDTNTLTQLKNQRRASEFFQQNARIPADVLVEAEQFPDIASLRELEYEITPEVLRELITVMASVLPENHPGRRMAALAGFVAAPDHPRKMIFVAG